MFKKAKTKWKPIYFYKPVASNNRVMLFARYDFKTGLYNFKSVKLGVNMYDFDLSIKYEPKQALDDLISEKKEM